MTQLGRTQQGRLSGLPVGSGSGLAGGHDVRCGGNDAGCPGGLGSDPEGYLGDHRGAG